MCLLYPKFVWIIQFDESNCNVLESLEFYLYVLDIPQSGMMGYSVVGLTYALYKWLFILGDRFLNLFSLFSSFFAFHILSEMCWLIPVLVIFSPSTFILSVKGIVLLFILISAGFVADTVNILNLALLVLIFQQFS